MNETIINSIAKSLKVSVEQVKNTLSLLEEGNTVPFIARYRKEATKGLDEEQILYIEKQYQYEQNLADRKEAVLKLISEQGKLTEEITNAINACTKLSQVEDLYKPYKQKKKTRAGIAIKNGLQPLADYLLSLPESGDLLEKAAEFVTETVKTPEDALQGAKDIVAENVSDNAKLRWSFKDKIFNTGVLVTKKKKDAEDEKKVYEMYYDRSEKVTALANHRVMAIDRAEKEKVITVSFSYDLEGIEKEAQNAYLKGQTTVAEEVLIEAINDGCERLLLPSVENEIRSDLSEKAHNSSIEVFSMNLEKLLLQPPMKDKVILGFDPAFRTGCKLAVIDASGKKLTVDVIYPHQPNAKVRESEQKLVQLCNEYHVNLIAIGNGTASRESEAFVANTIKKFNLPVSYTIVSEAGASVYSASKLAIEEFPDLHVEQRSAISIARRLMDPLSELIKIDPQSIGVGQYQHDLPTARLKERLDFVVEKAVNRVGVNINTASVSLLKNVAGLNNASASSIVSYREENGKIESRTQIKKIPKIGPKAFEQAAGFLRIEDGKEPLDRTSIHPESYKATKVLLKELGLDTSDLGTQKAKDVISNCDTEQLMKDTGLDSYTLKDILDAICLPLRDYRDKYDAPLLRKDVLEIEDLHINDKLEGTVRNVVDFGAFVDIGLHEDGLVHISKMSSNRVKHPSDVVSVGDIVTVWVYNIDQEKQKVQLTMVNPN